MSPSSLTAMPEMERLLADVKTTDATYSVKKCGFVLFICTISMYKLGWHARTHTHIHTKLYNEHDNNNGNNNDNHSGNNNDNNDTDNDKT
jgi:hypothetical protein